MNGNGKYVSIHTIIGKVYRDLGMVDTINLVDAVEWAGEAMELIGASYVLDQKIERLTIENYKAKLPCDLHYIETTQGLSCTVDDEVCDIDTSSYTPMRYSSDSFHHWYCGQDYFNDHNCNSALTYKINNDYIFTNFEEGYVLMSYHAIPVDENGYPKIPDDIKFIHAVSYHIMWRLAFIKWSQGKMPGPVYQVIERDRDFYIGAAQAADKMPSVDMMETIKNNWIRLIPKINHHASSFKEVGTPEQRINHNSKTSKGSNGTDPNTPTQDNYFYTT